MKLVFRKSNTYKSNAKVVQENVVAQNELKAYTMLNHQALVMCWGVEEDHVCVQGFVSLVLGVVATAVLVFLESQHVHESWVY